MFGAQRRVPLLWVCTAGTVTVTVCTAGGFGVAKMPVN